MTYWRDREREMMMAADWREQLREMGFSDAVDDVVRFGSETITGDYQRGWTAGKTAKPILEFNRALHELRTSRVFRLDTLDDEL